jgi:hypothetical protein
MSSSKSGSRSNISAPRHIPCEDVSSFMEGKILHKRKFNLRNVIFNVVTFGFAENDTITLKSNLTAVLRE